MSTKKRVAIIGASGYAGAEIVRLISGHPQVTLTYLTSRQYAGQSYDTVFPALTGCVDHYYETFSPEDAIHKADIFFLALPHKASMGVAAPLLEAGKKVIDLSADFRFKNRSVYENHYQPHEAPQWLKKAVYGLCEINHQAISNADLIGNPGCYPTSILLPLMPLLKDKLINTTGIIADSKSGVSGAGRSPSLGTLFCEVNEGFKAYKVAEHRHAPEMNENLTLAAGENVQILFVPHLVPMSRGIVSTIYVRCKTSDNHIRDCLHAAYENCHFIRILPDGHFPNAAHVRGTNYCDIGLKYSSEQGILVIISTIDNLIKGAAGQAVQNMNIMMNFAETDGINAMPYPV
ncbi:MAG: N-acetyl-gamma-glutamyl-phosphate reductase [Candidatus Magnetoglobus multicellularis str. Araruama]|uniref:N-acetyl-gamma-glutamyl-phosphate reductase n=1 Tax=Candidatus Magnetoglobus multicellularis str. Araruama TaxID=890399 RepID=A0A1V1PHX4_9BACT|nr:MAG: N-acetyl-gamma-glutamyl-phosphate reductase [Candidatus Magnetoglobus multicellularis str. Araruama]